MTRVVVLVVAVLALVGCSGGPSSDWVTAPPSTVPAPARAVVVPVPAPGSCHYGPNGSPDRTCTPGVADPAVTQQDLHTTVCVAGYTARVRPPVSYTAPLKRKLAAAYGLSGPSSAYQLDHLIALELGGAARDPRNLWPENASQGREKDRQENLLHRELCARTITLAQAQTLIVADAG